jgi:GMP synthase (glutamine-hydrolysing)
MILIIDCGSKNTIYIEECVDQFMDFETIQIHALSDKDLKKKKGIIISGAPLLITEMDMEIYLDKISFIKQTTIPVLGICFGHQLIGLSFGAFGSRMKDDRGTQLIEIFEESPLFDKLPSEIEMIEDHCESISIPANFKLIASSDACINESMQHTSLPLFGVQFHPEISGNHGRVLFDNFIRLCDDIQLKEKENK